MKKVSIKLLAETLNLSRNTVAKALTNSDMVAHETKERVFQKAAELGYGKLNPTIMNEYVHQPKSQIKNIIVLAHRDISSFWDEIALGIFDKVDKERYNILYNFISKDDEENLLVPTNLLNENNVGMILLNVFSQNYLNKLYTYQLPIVFLDTPVNFNRRDYRGDIFYVEAVPQVYQLTKEIIESGRKKIAFIGDITYCKSIYDRYEGYVKAMEEFKIPLHNNLCITQHTQARYYEAYDVHIALDKLPEMPEAFVCANDDVAVWVLNYYEAKGLKIPNDLVITGFDSRREFVAMHPSLTTVAINKNALGVRLAQKLLWRVANPNLPNETIHIQTDIKMGETFPGRN